MTDVPRLLYVPFIPVLLWVIIILWYVYRYIEHILILNHLTDNSAQNYKSCRTELHRLPIVVDLLAVSITDN